ncbi:MAG: hypothetical protein J7D60_09560 [Prosthecochloris sp.]|nr:hypothetical protein [Prosthecochloris sp.]
MSNVICSCMLGDNAKVRLRLSKLLQGEIERMYGDSQDEARLCEIELKGCRRDFFLNPGDDVPDIGQAVIVEADGGYDYGIVYSTGVIAAKKYRLKGLDKKNHELLTLLRFADEKDIADYHVVQEREPAIRELCLSRIRKHHMDMKLVDIDLRLDQQKVTVYYTASHRVDFRALVRDLASEFKARIQMVQITTREEARRANSFGACGCMLCCSSWMQKIHANPFSDKQDNVERSTVDGHSHNVIGQCNRPKCCLGYSRPERGRRKKTTDDYPPLGSKVSTPDGKAIIESIDPAKKEICLRYSGDDSRKNIQLEEFRALFVKK